MYNEVKPAYSSVFQSDIVATYETKEKTVKPLGLRIERHLDEVGFHPHVIAPYKVIQTLHWKLILPTIFFELCNYKKSVYYSELLVSDTDYSYILLIDLRMAIKELRLLSV